MASRWGGRGRGRGRGATYAKSEPFVLFPEDVNLPDFKVDDIDVNMKRLLNWSNKLQNYWKASPYLLEETTLKESQRMHVARFSDAKKTRFARDSLSQVLEFNDFPKELVQGTSRHMPSRKKFRWNPESEMKTLDFFEQLEKKVQGREDKGKKEKKDGENEDEDEDENAQDEEGEEDFSDDDYNQNEYFDDDEDDYNDADDGDDEGTY